MKYRKEHGSPQQAVAKIVFDLFLKGELTEDKLIELVKQYWKMAIITLEEDQKLNRIGARSKLYNLPEERWAHAEILVYDRVEKRIINTY